jgi:hypothetical protein
MGCLGNECHREVREAVAIQPFDRLTVLSGVEGLDYFVVPQSGASRNDRIPKQPLMQAAGNPLKSDVAGSFKVGRGLSRDCGTAAANGVAALTNPANISWLPAHNLLLL